MTVLEPTEAPLLFPTSDFCINFWSRRTQDRRYPGVQAHIIGSLRGVRKDMSYQLLPIEIDVVPCVQHPLLQKCAAWSSILWNQRHLAAQQQQSRIKPSSCAKPCFRSCSWEHTSLEHAQLPRQKPRSSSCLFIFLSLKFQCMKSTSPPGMCQTRGLASPY